jgi:hypothetical protein
MLDTMLQVSSITLADIDGELIPLAAMGGGFIVAIVAIVVGSVKSMADRKQKEESRRELAAYVAEGSMTTDEAERILEAGQPHWEKGKRRT